ncbi:MAG: STM4011 family radical SAM protein [Spirochaetota bacterium]
MRWNILYRGPLSSCNYSCSYCPFAKTKNTRKELKDDAAKLNRFVDWVSNRQEEIGILFTPWGEGLVHKYYQKAMTELSHLSNVYKVAIQTNLSCSTKWMEMVNRESFALWTTFHPTQISLERFSKKCKELDHMGVRYSVGFVALKEELGILEELRTKISPSVYVWANAFKRIKNYYSPQDIQRIEKVDPLFSYNTVYHTSSGKPCQAGYSSFSVDGDGNMRRCHFIPESIGNIYSNDLTQALQPRLCSNASCGCHIGYVHLEKLNLYRIYGDGILERIPE